MSYKSLEIWKLAREVVMEIHEMALKLPKFELYEEGAQIRKSSKNVKASIHWNLELNFVQKLNVNVSQVTHRAESNLHSHHQQ